MVFIGVFLVGIWYGKSDQKVKKGAGVIPETRILFCGLLSLKMCSLSRASQIIFVFWQSYGKDLPLEMIWAVYSKQFIPSYKAQVGVI